MAMFIVGMKCPLCGEVITKDDAVVSTTHFIPDEGDPLWRFSDAGLHQSCFLKWDKRDEFIRRYNDTIGQIVWGNGTRHHMNEDGRIERLEAKRE